MFSRSAFSLFTCVVLVLILSDGVCCHNLQSLRGKYLNGPWINKIPRPPVPAWPDQFSSSFYVYIEEYGENFRADGAIFYDWTKQTFRSDFYDWCLPLFDSGKDNGTNNYYTCSFLATDGNLYFVNHTADTWEDNQCCLFAEGLGAVPPDWMKVGLYNGTDRIQDTLVDVWWFPGTSDPNKPCYGYWSAQDQSKRPIQFFGLASIGPAILEYYTFTKDAPKIILTKPNSGCEEECKPPNMNSQNYATSAFTKWPEWPHC